MSNKTLIIIIIVLLVSGTAFYFIAKPSVPADQQANVNSNMTSNLDSDLEGSNSGTGDSTTESTTNNQTNMESGKIAEKGDMVLVHYTGKLTNGTVFDSSVGRGQPFGFVLGAGMVISGWEKGILGMKVGEKKTLTIPPEDGYGTQGISDPSTGKVVIPPNATLIFDVELVDVKR